LKGAHRARRRVEIVRGEQFALRERECLLASREGPGDSRRTKRGREGGKAATPLVPGVLNLLAIQRVAKPASTPDRY
jgi:hypothetical protein